MAISDTVTLYASIGERLTRYGVDVEAASLHGRETFVLPEGLQYLWRHATKPFLYAACSDGRPGFKGSRHVACALKMDANGVLSLHGGPLTLPTRPVHIATDRDSRYLLITYPDPSRVAVHRINDDCSIGAELPHSTLPQLAKTAHQALHTPSNDRIVLPLRGNHATTGHAEDPGALAIFKWHEGVMTHEQTLAPDGGYGFGPRHVDFHPTKPWMYMSIERENEIAFFEVGSKFMGPQYRSTTLERPEAEKPRQLVGAIHVHPSGRTVYVSNRADGTVDLGRHKVFNGGENSIAVFAIEEDSGKPTRIQNSDSHGMHVRTFSVDPSGRLLVAANMTTRDVLDDGVVRAVPGGLSCFRIANDGRLDFVRKYDADVAEDHMFWSGFVGL